MVAILFRHVTFHGSVGLKKKERRKEKEKRNLNFYILSMFNSSTIMIMYHLMFKAHRANMTRVKKGRRKKKNVATNL